MNELTHVLWFAFTTTSSASFLPWNSALWRRQITPRILRVGCLWYWCTETALSRSPLCKRVEIRNDALSIEIFVTVSQEIMIVRAETANPCGVRYCGNRAGLSPISQYRKITTDDTAGDATTAGLLRPIDIGLMSNVVAWPDFASQEKSARAWFSRYFNAVICFIGWASLSAGASIFNIEILAWFNNSRRHCDKLLCCAWDVSRLRRTAGGVMERSR